MSRSLKCAVWLVGAALSVTLPGCGGGSDGGGTTGPSNQPTTQTLPTQNFNNLQRGAAVFSDFNVSASGVTAEFEANWTFASNDIDIFVTNTSCATASYNTLFNQTSGCTSLARGTSLSRPERTSVALSPGTYRVYVGSSFISTSAESGTLVITLRR
jgi:hypothetical protein